MKYVALLTVDRPELWSRWTSGSTAQNYKSPIETDKKKVEKWLRDKLKEYPNARVNGGPADREYYIRTTVIAFDEKESKNFEDYLKHAIVFLS